MKLVLQDWIHIVCINMQGMQASPYVSASCGSVVKVVRWWLARCVCPTHNRSRWIRRKWWQAERVGHGSFFLPRQRAAHLWLWWIGMSLTHTHTHTCPTHSVSHTTTCTFFLSHGHTQTRTVDGFTNRLLRPTRSVIQHEMFTTHLRSLPPLSINPSQKYVWCIII